MAIALTLAVIPLCVLESEVPVNFLTGQIPLLLNMKHVFKAEISGVLKCKPSSNSNSSVLCRYHWPFCCTRRHCEQKEKSLETKRKFSSYSSVDPFLLLFFEHICFNSLPECYVPNFTKLASLARCVYRNS